MIASESKKPSCGTKVKSGDHVVVVGGGVIGAMCAWELSLAGCEVTIVERDRFGAACSHGNCGYISPSHVLPLCQPGAVAKTMRSMLKSNSPFAIKPRLSFGFAKWFLNFARKCNRSDMMATAIARHEMLASSKQLYQELIQNEGLECEWQEVGCLFVYDNEKELDAFSRTHDTIRENFGVSATRYGADELIELEPAIKPGLAAGAWHYECDCHMRPDLLMKALRERLESRGVTIIEYVSIDEFIREGSAAKAVGCNGDSIEADHFVVATGAMTPFLNKHLGMRVPIEPGKGYSLTMPTPAKMPKLPIIFEDSHVAITPMKSKYRIGSTMEFVGWDTSIHQRRLGLLTEAAKKYLHDPLCDPIEEEWFGWRPMTWDGKPIIDSTPAMKNVWIAAGHSMLGLSMATGTGRLLKEMMFDEAPHLDPAHFSAKRFI